MYENSLYLLFFYKPETAPRNKLYEKKKKKEFGEGY